MDRLLAEIDAEGLFGSRLMHVYASDEHRPRYNTRSRKPL
jgi:hypothetical protein